MFSTGIHIRLESPLEPFAYIIKEDNIYSHPDSLAICKMKYK